jgi:hypothetical protein
VDGGGGGVPNDAGCPPSYPASCDGVCVDLEADPTHCGSCDKACAIPGQCVNGSCTVCSGSDCTCPQGLTFCNGDCVNTASDAKNCGGCDSRCAMGCSSGICPLARSGLPFALAVDESNVYVISQSMLDAGSGGAVLRIPIAGGTATTLGFGNIPSVLALDTTQVYWATGDAIVRAPKDGGPVVTLASGQATPFGIAVGSNEVYWTTRLGGTVVKAQADGGGEPVTLASGQFTPLTLALGADSVYWANLEGEDGGPGSIVGVPTEGGSVTTLVAMAAFPVAIVVDAKNVYWTSAGPGGYAVMSRALGGGESTTLASATQAMGLLAVDSANVYFAAGLGTDQMDFPTRGDLYGVPVGGGVTLTLAETTCPFGIALDEKNVYWGDNCSAPSLLGLPVIREDAGSDAETADAAGDAETADAAGDAETADAAVDAMPDGVGSTTVGDATVAGNVFRMAKP